MFYVAKIRWVDMNGSNQSANYVMWASSFSDAAKQIKEDWGEDLVAIHLTQLTFEDEGPYLNISESLADTLIDEFTGVQ